MPEVYNIIEDPNNIDNEKIDEFNNMNNTNGMYIFSQKFKKKVIK